MRRKGFLKGLGAAVGALVAVPLAPLLPKVTPRIVHVPGGIPLRQGFMFYSPMEKVWLDLEDLKHLQMHMGRLMTYGQSTIYISSTPVKIRVSDYVNNTK